MSQIYSWKRYPFSSKKLIQLSDEEHQVVESFRSLWNSIGEKIIHEEYGIIRVEKNGDIVVKNIDSFLERVKEFNEVPIAPSRGSKNPRRKDFLSELDDLLDYDDEEDYGDDEEE